jgi:2-amino-4-hydroxy-6-hydroxymethyldihydropteridine diphosphokinase
VSSCVIALGSNLGDRRYNLLRAVHALGEVVRVVRLSSIHETEPVDAPPPRFLNMVLSGYTSLDPETLMDALLEIERRLGRKRRSVKNEPRVIDLDLILHGGRRLRTKTLTLPHPRARERAFVMEPLRVVWASGLPWLLEAER